MQLQGELAKTAEVQKLYKNPVQAFAVIYRNEGVRGLQQGLVSGYYYQLGLNGCRFGFYEPARYYLTKVFNPQAFSEGKIPQHLGINLASGFISGSAGAIVANPLFLIKTRMQSYTPAATHLEGLQTLGQQTYYSSVWDGMRQIYRSEGVKGWFRGLDAAILRTGAGSASQLTSYYYAKNWLLDRQIVANDTMALHFAASSAAGLAVAIVMNPWDVILTRVYNQKGDLYRGPVDCFRKTLRAEGPTAFYKGFWAQLLRIGPHSVLTLMFMEQCVKVVASIEQRF